MTRRTYVVWGLLAALVLAEVAYPLTGGTWRARLVVATVVLGFAASVIHAWWTHGRRAAVALIAVTTGGGFGAEALGVATGVPFGRYSYATALGPTVADVAWVIPLAWTWMAWPAWLAASRIVASRPARVLVAAVGLATWDLFLDPQMVADGYWRWADPTPALPGVPGIPLTNYVGWLVVAVGLMAGLAVTGGPRLAPGDGDAPMHAMYLWTYGSSVLAHAVFLDLGASAVWGGLGMGSVAGALAVRLWRT